MEAGANRDFNSIHHNRLRPHERRARRVRQSLFLMGMWERAVYDWTDSTARIAAIRGFRMSRFNTVGSTAVVMGSVTAVDAERGVVTFAISTSNAEGYTVGPGEVDVVF